MHYYIEGGGGGCFPAMAEVKLKNGKSVTMSELKIGNKVQTGIDLVISFLSLFLSNQLPT